MALASMKEDESIGGKIELVVGALAMLSRKVFQQAFPEDFALCSAAQEYRYQIYLSKDTSLRLRLRGTGLSTSSYPNPQGIYNLKTWKDYDRFAASVLASEAEHVPATEHSSRLTLVRACLGSSVGSAPPHPPVDDPERDENMPETQMYDGES